MTLGLLGGTFNPPHIAHLICATAAHEQLGIERVMLVPAHTPPHKEVHDDPGIEERLELCRLATEGIDWLSVCDLEARREGPSYTVDTLREIHAREPGEELTFVVEPTWLGRFPRGVSRQPLLELATVAVAQRAGVKREDLAEHLGGLAGAERLRFIDVPRLDISSSDLRARARRGNSLRHLVPQAVADHIEQGRLYT